MPRPVRFHFDYASPWAYLASELLARELPGIEIRLEPVYLRGFDSFSGGLPYSNAKLAYLTRDFARCSAQLGVPTAPPADFPINGVHALRGALVAQEQGCIDVYHRGVMRAVWAQSRSVKDTEGVLAIAAELGLDREAFAARIGAEEVKQRLKDATAEASEAGVFGVPTFRVSDELFWGHDRMAYARRAAEA